MSDNTSLSAKNGVLNSIVEGRTLINNDSFEIFNKYIDEICEDPLFLCNNKDLCGNNTTIYANVKNVETICKDIKESSVCENNIKECIVLAHNSFNQSQKFVSTSFENIIVPIPKSIDENGNQKFIRLPQLQSSRKPDSMETCNVCACMDRFARSPGSGFNDYTSPGQNKCVYSDDFEYYYYPVQIEKIRNSNLLKDPPPVIVSSDKNKYNVLNKNIIALKTEDELSVTSLYKRLTGEGISEFLTNNFILNILYKNDKERAKELKLYTSTLSTLSNKTKKSNYSNISRFGSSNNKNILVFIIFIILIYMFIKK